LDNGNPVVVAPTGSGKSMMIAMLMHDAVTQWPGTRVLCMADVKELIEQDASAYAVVAESSGKRVPFGIFSASVGRRESDFDITFAQIQSAYRTPERFGRVDFVCIDEAHMVNPKRVGMYRDFLAVLHAVNPSLKVVGYTATPYRMGAGYIWTRGKDAIFGGIAFEVKIDDLIAQGYLVPPVGFAGKVEADCARIEHSSTGEFKEESATVEFSRITADAVSDAASRLRDRTSVMVFACSVAHAVQIAETLRSSGEHSVAVVTGETHKAEREAVVARVKSGECRWIVNCGVFTKGFDAKNIDAVVLLRATESAALYVQMVGRGLRPCDGKQDCIVLDYGQNIVRHGPINAVRPKQKRSSSEPSQALAKACQQCSALIAIGARECPYCKAVQPVNERTPKHDVTPSNVPILATASVEWKGVMAQRVSLHGSSHSGVVKSVRVDYQIAPAMWVSEWVCPNHQGYARSKAAAWMEARGYGLMPAEDAANVQWPAPQRIKVKFGGKFPEVLDYFFGPNLLMG